MSLRTLWQRYRRSRRARIVVSAALISMFSGIVGIGLPVEDWFVNARGALRQHEAPKDIVMIGLDDKTLSEIGASDVPRAADAKMIEMLLAAGARQVLFDRSYHFEEDPADDAILVETLKRHKGKVVFGAIASNDDPMDYVSMLPAQKFREHVKVASVATFFHPFDQGISMPYSSDSPIGRLPSMSAMLADSADLSQNTFRPDFGILTSTVPSFSYGDVLNRRVDISGFKGKKVIIGPTALTFEDYHRIPWQGYLPGVYNHIVGAHTIRSGAAVDIGWVPLFAATLVLVVLGIKRGSRLHANRNAAFAAIVLLLPFAFDAMQMIVQVFPAILLAAITSFRLRGLDKEAEAGEKNLASGLPSLQLLRNTSGDIPGSLIALKVRNYVAIVSSFGTPVEEELSSELVRRIRIGDPEATVFHEGDIFAWPTSLTNPLDIVEHLEGLHRIVRGGVRLEDSEIDLSFNCGVDVSQDLSIAARVSNCLKAVDQAVRTEELVLVHDSSGTDVQWEITLLGQLDRAIDSGDVWVAYQPKLDLRSGRITGAEALVRWNHPERGPISPDLFIRIAEEYHRIDRITSHVLDEAIRAATAIRRIQPDFSISVNISAQLLRFSGLPDMVMSAVNEHGFPPSNLTLEITETDRLDRSSKTIEMMQQLVDLGLNLSIDDFGTGNATIDYLRYLPASEVKIDKIFVSNMESSNEDMLLVQSIIEMAHSLDRKVVAEGVETARIIELLQLLDCDTAQGFHISRPVPLGEFLGLVDRDRKKQHG